jgi:hypothetical protein
MNSTDVKNQASQATPSAQSIPSAAAETEAKAAVAPAETVGLCSSKTSCPSEASACGTGSCSSSSYTAKAFFIPFLAVTAYSVIQGNMCATTDGHACAASAVGVGILAGLTSVALVKTIKSFRKSR